MPVRRHGDPKGFFDGTTVYNNPNNLIGGVTVPAGAVSQAVQIGRGADNFSFYVHVVTAVATTWLLQVAHSGSPDAQGVLSDRDSTTYTWHDAWYLGTVGSGNSTKIQVDVGASGGSVMAIVPDFVPGWVRLKRIDANADVTVTAGWECQSD